MADMPNAFLSVINEKPGKSPSNRSLERGVEILRAFRPGSELLGNGELAERTGLSKSTVSRLTQTLVGCGMLQLDSVQRAYRLAPATLSLAHAMRSGSRVLAAAAPHMQSLAQRRQINVGLAAPDRDEMVYLESIRYARRAALRHVVSGQRVPMELTSLGRAYLAVAPEPHRYALMKRFSERRKAQWASLRGVLDLAFADVHDKGFCTASWQPEVVALATPFFFEEATYVLNISLSTKTSPAEIASEFSPMLLALRDMVERKLAALRADFNAIDVR